MEIINDDLENIYIKFVNISYVGFIKVGIDDYIKNKFVSLLEKLIDNYIMSMMRDVKIILFGVELLVVYIYVKEIEIKIIRIIMVGKFNNIGVELIKERLCDIYV